MSHPAPTLRTHSALRLRQLRQRAGLSRADLAALSGVRLDFIGALENDHLGRLLSDPEIEAALQKWAELGPQRLMQRPWPWGRGGTGCCRTLCVGPWPAC